MSLSDEVVNNLDFLGHNLWCSVGVVDGLPRAGSHYNFGTSPGPDKIGSPAGPGPRAASCTWLVYDKNSDGSDNNNRVTMSRDRRTSLS